jgi:hypothetical protein
MTYTRLIFGEPVVVNRLYYGTWFEAARVCVSLHEVQMKYKYPRKLIQFKLPDTKFKKDPFFIM